MPYLHTLDLLGKHGWHRLCTPAYAHPAETPILITWGSLFPGCIHLVQDVKFLEVAAIRFIYVNQNQNSPSHYSKQANNSTEINTFNKLHVLSGR